MADYIISCSSTVDLSNEYMERRGIPYTCFHFELDGVDYPDDMGRSMDPETLYDKMSKGASTKTSQVTIGDYTVFFENYLKKGMDILHICFSSGLSGAYSSALVAAESLREQFPERKLYIVDSLAASSGHGLLVDTLADMRDAGADIDSLRDFVLENRLKLNHWFFSTDLTFYIRGGRISKASGFIGSVLNICPLLNVNNEGKLIPREKIRGKKRVIRRIVEQMEMHARDGHDYDGKCFISQSACMEDAREVAALIEEKFPKLAEPVQIFPIGTTIGSHTGPGTVAVFFWGDERGE
ncbi:MAG: DegV family protein [Lachnospiraceae bacterium]|nr:DegV family protein [Lachnospiraceae bacterium]